MPRTNDRMQSAYTRRSRLGRSRKPVRVTPSLMRPEAAEGAQGERSHLFQKAGASRIPPGASFIPAQPVFPSFRSGSGYQLFNYFQIVEPGSGLNKSHWCQFPGKSFHILWFTPHLFPCLPCAPVNEPGDCAGCSDVPTAKPHVEMLLQKAP